MLPFSSLRKRCICRFPAFGCSLVLVCATLGQAQVSASLSGKVTDPSGAFVSGASIIAKNEDTGAVRTTATNRTGQYQLPALPIGHYEIKAQKTGFAEEVRTGVNLVVGQDAQVDLALRLGTSSQELTVNADAAAVNTSPADITGLVGEREVKNLPLNGRSFDLLMTLSPGVVNFTSQKTGGVGVSNSTVGNNFAVSGNRP